VPRASSQYTHMPCLNLSASTTVTVGMGCTHNGVSTLFNNTPSSLLTLGLQLCLPCTLSNFQVQTSHFMGSEPADSVIGGLGGCARPLLLVLLLTLFCCALLQVIAVSCRRICISSPGFQCCDSCARHLHVVVSGGSWRGPETHAFCFSHVSRAHVHVAVVSKDSVSTPLLN